MIANGTIDSVTIGGCLFDQTLRIRLMRNVSGMLASLLLSSAILASPRNLFALLVDRTDIFLHKPYHDYWSRNPEVDRALWVQLSRPLYTNRDIIDIGL